MPALTSVAFPRALVVVRALLSDLAPVRLAPPPDFTGGQLITISELPGHTSEDGTAYTALVLVSSWGTSFPEAAGLADAVQVRIESAGCTEVDGVLIDSAGIYTGAHEAPDAYPDERRLSAVFEFVWRRQFRP